MIGNIQVSFLTALCIFNIAIYDICPDGILSNNGELMIFKIITYYAILSAIITFIREILKDIEDYNGDLSVDAKTFVITYGIRNAKTLSMAFILLMLISIFDKFLSRCAKISDLSLVFSDFAVEMISFF